MNKVLSAATLTLSLLLASAGSVVADGTTTKVTKNCTTDQYGSQSCREDTETTTVHKPIPAGLGDINPVVLTITLAMGSVALLHLSKKVSRSYVSQN